MTNIKKQSHHLNERVAIIEVDNNYLHKALDELKQGQKDIIQEMRQGFIDVRKEIADVRKESWAQMRWMMGFMLAVIASPYIAPDLIKFIKAIIMTSA